MILEVDGLKIHYSTRAGAVRAVDGASFAVPEGRIVGLVGESGCGKTTAVRAIMGVLAENGRRAGGRVIFKGRTIDEQATRKLLWRDIAYVPQSAMSSLDPVYTVGSQLVEVLTKRGNELGAAARARAAELFDLVGLSESRLADYPHQFSGGMRQRAAIAMALALKPSLLLADEPVTALDVIVQRQILDVLRELQQRLRLSMVLVTHDISVVAYLCDDVVVMYAGQVIESGPVREVLARPRHPYTMGLRNAFPDLLSDALELVPISGSPPDLSDPPSGCRFAPRCPFALAACATTAGVDRRRRHPNSCLGLPARRRGRFSPQSRIGSRNMAALVELRDVVKHFPVTRSLGEIVRGQYPAVHALDGVSFDLGAGDAVAIVGESGCGKTTLGRLLLKLAEPTAGSIVFDGVALAGLDGERLRDFRRQAQLVFQNPFDALNPRFTVYRAVAEPLVNAGIDRAEHADRVAAAFRRVHLADLDRYLDKYPHQLSGGQLQRVVLARALVLAPRFLVADEPVSMLDVSVRAGILALMREIRETMGLTAVYISHDLALVRYLCDRTLVMYLGCIVEDGPTEEIVRRPRHPYSQALVAAVPVPDADQSRAPLPISGSIPDAREPPSGCRFRDRCPRAMARCAEETPLLRTVAGGHRVACHLDLA